MSQFGPGPASILGTALPMPFTPGMPQIPWARNVPDSVVWSFRTENMGMVLAARQAPGGAAVAGTRTRSSTPVGERAGGSQRMGPSGLLSAWKSPEKVAMVSAIQRRTAEASTSAGGTSRGRPRLQGLLRRSGADCVLRGRLRSGVCAPVNWYFLCLDRAHAAILYDPGL